MAAILQEREKALKAQSAEKSAVLRVMVGDRGGLDQAVGADAELRDKLVGFGIQETIHSGALHIELLKGFFNRVKKTLADPALAQKAKEEAEKHPKVSEEQQERVKVVRDIVDSAYGKIWESYNVDKDLGGQAMFNPVLIEGLSEEEDGPNSEEAYSGLLEEFMEAEQGFVGIAVLGEDEYNQRVTQRERMMTVQKQVRDTLNELGNDTEAVGKYLMGIQMEARKVQEKLQKMPEDEALAYMENPSDEDAECMMRMQALEMLLGGGSNHGHSHNGEPCHGHGGHGHSHEAPAHGHSHNGEPCHGHGGHSHAPQPGHGHSHGGKPCHGHGH